MSSSIVVRFERAAQRSDVVAPRLPCWAPGGALALLLACSSTTAVAPPPRSADDGLRPPADLAQREPALAREADSREAGSQQSLLFGPVLERAAYVRAVLRRNPTIEAARQAWSGALARARQSGALEDPMVELGVAPLSIASAEARFGWEASVSQKLPWFGKRALEEAVSSAEAAGAGSDYESVRRELALTAVALYEQYFIAARAREINAAHVELLGAMRDAAGAQLASGRGSAQDVLQADAELAHLEHDAVVLLAERDITLAQLNELLHRAPELPLPPPPAQLPPPPPPELDAARSEQAATETRPDIRALEQRAQAAQARSERAEREFYPDVTLSSSYSSMWDMPAHRWMVGVGFNVPIQTGRRGATLDEARALRSQLEGEVTRLRDSVRLQVFVGRKQLEESKHVLALFETRLLPLARQRIEAARSGFATSHLPFLVVMDAERSLRGLELDYQKARAQQVRRRAELDRALGLIPGLDWKEVSP